MSSFLPTVKKEYDFDGDTIHVEFRRLNREQMLILFPFLPTQSQLDGNEPLDDEKNMNLLSKSMEALKENVVSFKGLKDGNGVALSFDEAYGESYFFKMFVEIARDLISESMVDPKKPNQ